MTDTLDQILHLLSEGKITVASAKKSLRLHSIKEIKAKAKLDLNRKRRTGVPEAILAEGKSPQEVATFAWEMALENGYALVTRVKQSCVKEIKKKAKKEFEVIYNKLAKTVLVKQQDYTFEYSGTIGVISAGTSDIPVAEEAKVAAEVMGCEVITCYDVGIAGLHRLFEPLETMIEREVSAIVVVAGMEGALPSVVASLVDVPVVGVPTSVGYGFGKGGIGALMTMLQTCSPGLAVVNIDNGFGAGVYAALISKRCK
ncbi:MAG: nickel pincer cofactor biosynthesis protein LarB [Methanosarcinales archaeon]